MTDHGATLSHQVVHLLLLLSIYFSSHFIARIIIFVLYLFVLYFVWALNFIVSLIEWQWARIWDYFGIMIRLFFVFLKVFKISLIVFSPSYLMNLISSTCPCL